MPLEGSTIYNNHNGDEEQSRGLEDAMNNDIISIRFDYDQKIAYFSLNKEDPIEIDISSETYYPFVRMKCVGSKVKIINMISKEQ